MAKKSSNLLIILKSRKSQNIPSSKKSKKLNQFKKKRYKNKKKKKKNNDNDKKNSSTKKVIFSNQNSSHKKRNTFTFNEFFNEEKERDKPVWMKTETVYIENVNNRFNEEILEYANYIIPQNLSLVQRQTTIYSLKKIIQKYRPNWEVVLFGSFSQNLSTIFSDLDFAIIENRSFTSRSIDINQLYCLMRVLKNENFSNNLKLIKARVPILKGICSLTGVNVDISMNRQSGYQAASLIRKILDKHKILKPTIIILKILLKNNSLNEASTGGMSSFLLFHLVYFYFIQYQKKINEGNLLNGSIFKNEDPFENNSKNNDNWNDDLEIVTYDSNCDIKSNNSNNDNRTYISKTFISTDEDDISNDNESNFLKNWISSYSSSSEERKLKNRENNKGNNFYYDDNCSDSHEEYRNSNLIIDYNREVKKNNDKIDIGSFLLSFLKFYGFDFDYEHLGFSVNNNNFGCTFFKDERPEMNCSNTICAENIQEQGVDIGKSCYNYKRIVCLFKATYDQIRNEKQKNTCSILKSLGFPSI